MKLVLYSGGPEEDNRSLDQRLIELSGTKKPQITYIPSSSYFAHSDFYDFAEQFQKYRVNKLINFPVDVEYSDVLKREVLTSDIIFLGGGNTYYFLKHLRKSGMLKELKTFVRNGGVLAGLSAGAIIMTADISTAGFPDFDKDDNDENLKNLKSLKLVNFDFFPHYKNSKRYDDELKRFSKKSKRLVYACSDSQGIVVNGKNIEFFGRACAFYEGRKVPLR